MSKYHRPMLLSLTNCPASMSLEKVKSPEHARRPLARQPLNCVFSGVHIVLMTDDRFHFEEG